MNLLHLYEPGMTYLLTSVTYHRAPLFANPRFAPIAHQDIAFYAAKSGAVSLAHVVMPDHVHWVIYPSPDDLERFVHKERDKGGKYAHDPDRFYLRKIIEDYKRHTSLEINRLTLDTRAQSVARRVPR